MTALILPRRGLLRAMLAAPAIVAAPSLMRVSTVAADLPRITGAEFTAVWYDEAGMIEPFGVTPAMIEKWKRQLVAYADSTIDVEFRNTRFIPFNPRGT